MARVPLPSREDLTDERAIEQWDRVAARGPVHNIMRLLLLNADVHAEPIRTWRASGLSRRSRELVILRCAFRRESRYEWHQHVRIARAAGIPDADINAVAEWTGSDVFSSEERVLLAFVDAMADAQRPDDATFAAMAAGRTPAEVVGVTFLVTQYLQLAHLMAAMDLETEEEFVGWHV